MSLPLLLKDIRFTWPGKAGFALDVPSFSVAAGERVLLVGESGSGKSTLLSLICGFAVPQAGAVILGETDLARLRQGARDRFRAEHIGVILQQFNLLPHASVADNVALPLHFAPERRRRAGNAVAEARRLCQAMALPEAVLGQCAGRLSIGQQQRVAAARALIGRPGLIVADEPTSALDSAAQDAFLSLLFAQTGELGASLLMVSHDLRLAPRFDRVLQIGALARARRLAA
jgi:putative ABC transport system ATP-binding protein